MIHPIVHPATPEVRTALDPLLNILKDEVADAHTLGGVDLHGHQVAVYVTLRRWFAMSEGRRAPFQLTMSDNSAEMTLRALNHVADPHRANCPVIRFKMAIQRAQAAHREELRERARDERRRAARRGAPSVREHRGLQREGSGGA